jgi:hypothetical protein
MYITKQEVEKILAVMNEFSDAKSYKLESDTSSGIGSVMTLTMDMKVKDRDALVKIEISGVEDW